MNCWFPASRFFPLLTMNREVGLVRFGLGSSIGDDALAAGSETKRSSPNILMISEIASVAVMTVMKWMVYTGLLWGLIKVQKLNYNVLGLLGSSLAATLVGLIPVVGPYLASVVLVVCLWKCTGAEIYPDVVFTVGIAGALMFCVNLWAFGALMGTLRSDLAVSARGERDADTSAGTGPGKKSNEVLAAASAVKPAAAPVDTVVVVQTNLNVLTLKGISFNATQPSVMIFDGSRLHSVGAGEVFTATLPQGRTKLRCETITRTFVVLKTEQGEPITVSLHQPPMP